MKNRKPLIAIVAVIACLAIALLFPFPPARAVENTQILKLDTGLLIGSTAAEKVGFFAATPVAQPAGATQAAITDSTTGTASATLAAGVGITTVSIPLSLAGIANGDMVTNYTPGYKFKILDATFVTTTVASTAAKAATLNLEIGTTDVTGGVIALTTVSCDTRGELTAGTSITAANTGTAADTISVEAASVTTFVEGSGALLIRIQNMDTADAVASEAALLLALRTALLNLGLIKGSS